MQMRAAECLMGIWAFLMTCKTHTVLMLKWKAVTSFNPLDHPGTLIPLSSI